MNEYTYKYANLLCMVSHTHQIWSQPIREKVVRMRLSKKYEDDVLRQCYGKS